MNIAILGANGRSGVCVVDEAVRRGHHVFAGARGKHAFTNSESLTVVECDILNPNQVGTLISQADAVVSVIGHVRKSPAYVQSDGITNVIAAMKEKNKTRLISLTGTGVRLSGDHIALYDYVLNLSISIIDPKRIRDGKKHVEIIKASGLDWTIIRVLKLQNTSPRSFRLSEHGPTKLYVSREDVAKAIIDVLEQDSFVGQMPILSKD